MLPLPQKGRRLGPVLRKGHQLLGKTAALPLASVEASIWIFFHTANIYLNGETKAQRGPEPIQTTQPRNGSCLVSGALPRALLFLGVLFVDPKRGKCLIALRSRQFTDMTSIKDISEIPTAAPDRPEVRCHQLPPPALFCFAS